MPGEDELARFAELVAPPVDPGAGTTSLLAAQLEQLRLASQAQTEAAGENTRAVIDNTTAQLNTGSSKLESVGSALTAVFKSGLGLSPVITGLVRLFGGGDKKPEPPPLARVYRPPAIHWEAGLAPDGRVYPIDYAQGGRPRAIEPGAAAEPQVTIQVQALDSRSFLDHSEEIARAVREAMLNAHALNDVVNEL